ncbi:Rpn family recombination-promoting nuclease/putative transposase [Allocoleopsis sp.]|uniref:Rpn family recombination-promoting nuclease/putative transposase n=1 Tax=Allocoleopsis sp. TaxID=3088169 RepID=UPI002FD4245E
MKTDTLFYRLFQSFPSIFFELINQPPAEANAYQFSSVEVKQLSFRIDGVFLPVSNAPSRPIYFVEVQFQPDPKFYSRFFTEIFLYLDKTKLRNNWRGVVVYPTRSIDTGETKRYIELLHPQRVRRIYLDELGSTPQPSIGIETVKLVIEPEETAGTKARELIGQARLEIADEAAQQELIELIERIISYKFPQKSREEIAQMLGLTDFRQTRVYQETAEEVKLESVPRFLSLGLSVEQIAQGLDLDIEQVRQAAVSHLLTSGMSLEQVAETLSLDRERVTQIEASNAQSDNPTKEE